MSANNINEINDQVASILGITDAPIANAPVLVVSAPVAPATVFVQAPPPAAITVANTGDVIADDSDFARQHLHRVLETTTNAINELMVVAQQSQSARSYEVLNQLLNTQRETARELLRLQQDKVKVSGTVLTPKGNTNIGNAVFVGTNADLLRLMKGPDKAEDARAKREALDAEFEVPDQG